MSAPLQRRIIGVVIAIGVASVTFYMLRVLMNPGGVKVLRPKDARPPISEPKGNDAAAPGGKNGPKVPSKFGEDLGPTQRSAPQTPPVAPGTPVPPVPPVEPNAPPVTAPAPPS